MRVGIIGCGNVCEVKSVPGFNKIENSNVCSVYGRNLDKVKDFQSRHSYIKRYTNNVEELINDEEVCKVFA